MGIISWIFLGLIVGILARWIMPGEQKGGFFLTVLLGIGGALLGGFLGRFLGLGPTVGFSLGSLALATGGALLILWIHSRLSK